MKIIIGKRKINEQGEPELKRKKSYIYQCAVKIKLRKDADRELLKTDMRAIKGVTIVTTVVGSEHLTDAFVYQTLKIKFQPYGIEPVGFIKNLHDSFRKLNKRGLSSFHFHPESLKKIEV